MNIHNTRCTDPVTSFIAGDEIEKTGVAGKQRQKCLECVLNTPGLTAAEIAHITGLERHAPSRRLPELREAGLVKNTGKKVCSVTGNLSMTWEVV